MARVPTHRHPVDSLSESLPRVPGDWNGGFMIKKSNQLAAIRYRFQISLATPSLSRIISLPFFAASPKRNHRAG